MRNLFFLVLLFTTGLHGQINDLIVFAQPFGATINTTKVSPVGPCTTSNPCTGFPNGAGILNKSQGGHLLVLYIPAAVADVTPIQVRIEASYTCPNPPLCTTGNWFPISPDITVATFVSGSGTNVGAIGVTKANGAFPYIRINSLVPTPASEAMTVRYSGFPFPIGSASVDTSGTVNIFFVGPVSGPVSTNFVQNKFLLIEPVNTVIGDCVIIEADGNAGTTPCAGSSLSGLEPHMTYWKTDTTIGQTPGVIWVPDSEAGTDTLLAIDTGSAQVLNLDVLEFRRPDHTTINAAVNLFGTFRTDAPGQVVGASKPAYTWTTKTSVGGTQVWSQLTAETDNRFGILVNDSNNYSSNGPYSVADWQVDATTGIPDTMRIGDIASIYLEVNSLNTTAPTGPTFTFHTRSIDCSAPDGSNCPAIRLDSVNPAGFGAVTKQMWIDMAGGVRLGRVTRAQMITGGGQYGNFTGSAGTMVLCTDCNPDATCTAGGTGAIAKMIVDAGAFICN